MSRWLDAILVGGPYVVAGLTIMLAALAAGHAVLWKRDTRAVVLWVGLICLLPLAGALLYWILGVNRIRRQAALMRGDMERFLAPASVEACSPEAVEKLSPNGRHLGALATLVEKVVLRPLLPGNVIRTLEGGDAAFPAMLEAIRNAERSVALCTYIFDRDEAGDAFREELGRAVRRGVEVRVLIDATGVRYSWPTIRGALRREGVRHALFLRTFPLWQLLSLNLRNHRKILVVDGRVAFTGGMNIRVGHWLSRKPKHPVRDLQFQIEGPVVGQVLECFADDWLFTTGESLRGPVWFPLLSPCGNALARGITDGPDEDFEKLRWALLGALSLAKHSVRIATPYFLPEPTIIAALNLAAMRGVAVDILLPSRSNLPFVQWASAAHWWQLLERGCRLWLSPPPFDHTKLMVVDGLWCLVGSTNWDPRSLRLNFEFNVEAYDPALAAELTRWFEGKLKESHETSLREMDVRSLPVRLRDGVARLLTPYL